MDTTYNEHNITIQYFFHENNSSCRKELHTPTNLLILSLAVADLLVGLIAMPVNIMKFMDFCWYLGKMTCIFSEIITGLSTSGSLFSLVFIAVDRYMAVCDPLLYSSRITVCKMSVFITLGWSLSLLYVVIYYYSNDHILPSQTSTKCYGECAVLIKYYWLIIDLVFSFLVPCSVILVLYSIIFKVARRQAKAVRAVTNAISRKVSSSSETKAAKILGIVIFMYLACWIPFYLSSLSLESVTSVSMVWTVFGWLICINSSVNPLIYAIFYPWFRESAKYILSCRIFEYSSSKFNLFPQRF
ncbi:trace amine-associated receptor 13c-like [Colossoma macropomum]|uniref:trace amine-associated receptor 13c-like n=1 Tax=Colossoma macropomum TaxID=42526 RepID=UPI001865001B|nr:trace amine-associated receptor 13c-like [Colossoma macropomum]